MKKIFGVLVGFLIAGFITCLIIGLVKQVPLEAQAAGKTAYKLLNGVDYFLSYLPGLVFAGFSVSFAVYFGHNCESSGRRYSAAMAKRMQMIMISGLVSVFILTLANEAFGIIVKQKKTQIVNRPGVINEYIRVAKDFYDQGYNKRAKKYAQAALALDPKSREASEIFNLAEIEIRTENAKTPVFNSSAEPVIEKNDELVFDETQVALVYDYLQKAKDAYAQENWFDAHYFAQQGLVYVTAKDPNESELKSLSVKAWANLTEVHNRKKTPEQMEFEEKYRGYVALVEKDELKAYYIFKKLSESNSEGARDPDVLFYLDIAQKKVEEKTFFIDETLELESFEEENNVYFTYNYPNGAKDIWYFKGVNNVSTGGLSVQYLRDFNIVSFDKDGQWERTLHTPYAKVLPVASDALDDTVKEKMNIQKDTDTILYILLKSVGRNDEEQVWKPEYSYADGTYDSRADYLLAPIDYKEFVKLEHSAGKPEEMPLSSLLGLAFKAKEYGFSGEMYEQILLNRCLYPLYVLFLILLLASFAWNNRIGATQYFKFSWLLSFPLLIVVMLIYYEIGIFLFHLLNYTLVIRIDGAGALFGGIGLYMMFMILSIVYFLSRKTE